MDIIQTSGLSKRFGSVPAVEHVSLHVAEGEIYGFLGLNGAGKTTTIRMLLGMIRPSAGSVSLFGQTLPAGHAVWGQIGYLVETPKAYPTLTVRENLEICRRLHGIQDPGRIPAIMGRLGLGAYAQVQARHLSMGNAQRLGLAKALLHQPRLLLLDEPVNGLDPAGMVEIRELLLELAAEGVTIFLSSHLLGEIARLARRIGIIHAGRLVREQYSAELEQELRRTVRLEVRDPAEAAGLLEQAGLGPVTREGHWLTLESAAALQAPEAVSVLLAPSGLRQQICWQEDLESYFLRIVSAA